MKLVRLIKICSNKTYNMSVFVYINITDAFPNQNGFKQVLALEYAFRKVHENREGPKLKDTQQLLVNANENINIMKNIEALLYATEEVSGLSRKLSRPTFSCPAIRLQDNIIICR
jgi:hypothetical protein